MLTGPSLRPGVQICTWDRVARPADRWPSLRPGSTPLLNASEGNPPIVPVRDPCRLLPVGALRREEPWCVDRQCLGLRAPGPVAALSPDHSPGPSWSGLHGVMVESAIDAMPRLRPSADALASMNASGSGSPAVPPMQKKLSQLHPKNRHARPTEIETCDLRSIR